MAKLTIDDQPIEAPDGIPLVEVLKQHGFYIANLCYIDGLPPYAGCRSCLVEIEGARFLQLTDHRHHLGRRDVHMFVSVGQSQTDRFARRRWVQGDASIADDGLDRC